jgi:hypothetical protein
MRIHLRCSRFNVVVMGALFLLTLVPSLARAQSAYGGASLGDMIVQFIDDWQARATRIQSEQPRWITPLVTVTPRLEQEFRYDQFWQANQNGQATDNFGGSKGLELIPYYNTEVILGYPAWIAHRGSIRLPTKKESVDTDGWGDQTFLLKYRLLSANEENGNYIVTAFMGFSAPTGDDGNSAGHGLFTPTIAAGKGYGDFSVQSTLGVTFPSGGVARLGWPLVWNTAFQYHIFKYFWPEVETNYTWFAKGEHTGKNQLFMTPGLVLGRFPIRGRLGVTIGAGYQVAVTKYRAYNNNVILSLRVPF